MKRIMVAMLAMLAAACAREVSFGPPSIKFGVDVCDGCGMTISEARYAAAVAGPRDGERRVFVFDDIGCLARWEARVSGFVPAGRWVHDRNSERWIEASAAVFVRSAAWATPMGSGLAAFSTSADAGTGTEPMRWEQVLDMARRGALEVPMSSITRDEAR